MLKPRTRSANDLVFDLSIGILLFLMLVIFAYPLIFILSASFSNPHEVMNGRVWLLPKGLTTQAYMKVFQDEDIWLGYRNTILYTVIGTTINILMTIMASYPLSRKDLRGRNFFMLAFTLTMYFQGGLIPTYLLIKNLHMYNTFWVMVIPNAVTMYNVIIMRTYFQNTIPMELQEAAFIDGCTNIGILVRVVMPLSMPIIAVMVLFYGVGHWNEFFNAIIYLSSRKRYPLQVFLREILIQNQMNDIIDSDAYSIMEQHLLAESIKYAVIIVSSLPVLLLYPFLQRYFVKGVMIGAIKG